MTKGEKVVEVAERYLGVTEVPFGSNRGPEIDKWQQRWGLLGEPWCGMFVDAMFAEAGVPDNGIPHPAVHQMVVNAQSAGKLWDRTGKIPTGALWMNDWIHTGIVVEHIAGNDYVDIIDGNSSNAVKKTRRSLAGNYIAIPDAITISDGPTTVTKYEWYLRDQYAKPFIFRNKYGKPGLWDTKIKADRAIASLLSGPNKDYWGMLKPRSVKAGIGKWVIQLGDVYLYGPWRSTKESVLIAKKRLEADLGRRIELIERPYVVRVS